MHGRALGWAAATLGEPISGSTALTGGMTSTILALVGATGGRSVLRLMTEEPWRTHGAALTARERDAFDVLGPTPVPAPRSLGLDADGTAAGEPAHLMSYLPGTPTVDVDRGSVAEMARVLATVHAVRPAEPFRSYQSWAWPAKWVVPEWTSNPASWERAFDVLAQEPPAYRETFLHRDFSHRNLLWDGDVICGVVDWVETSTGPAWLDAGHAATNLAVAFGSEPARGFLEAYAAESGDGPDPYWLVMDAVGFLPPPGRRPMFASATELARLDGWLHDVVART